MKGMLLPPILTGYGGWTNAIWAFGCTGYALALTSYLGSLWPVLAEHNRLTSAIMGWACQGTTMEPVGVVSIVYGLMSYAATGVLPYDQIAGQNLSVTACVVIIPLIFSAMALRQKSVDVALLNHRREEIIEAALNAEE